MSVTGAVIWASTTPEKDLAYRCDLCGAPADTLHFIPWVVDCEEVLFACPKHDPGGYWITLTRWFDPAERFLEHVEEKCGNNGVDGTPALALLRARQTELRLREAAAATKA